MKIIEDLEQGSLDWIQQRMCKISGTKLKKVMGSPWDRMQLLTELIAEEGTEQAKVMRPTAEMDRGTDEEEFAIKAFEKKTGKIVDEVGICIHKDKDWLRLSPDGLIKGAGGKYTEAVEVKSPDSKTAVLYRLLDLAPEIKLAKSYSKTIGVPNAYIWQVVHYFIVNEDLEKLHFVVYDERFINDKLKLHIVEVDRDNPILQDMIEEATEALNKFREDWLKYRDMVLPSNF